MINGLLKVYELYGEKLEKYGFMKPILFMPVRNGVQGCGWNDNYSYTLYKDYIEIYKYTPSGIEELVETIKLK